MSFAGSPPAGAAVALDGLLARQDSAPSILLCARSSGSVPGEESLDCVLNRPGNVWHAGLAPDMEGLPGLIDFVAPTWMLNCDPDPAVEATSWRLSFAACLVRADALRQVGGVRTDFCTVAGVALELGYSLVSRGAFVRHIPSLLERGPLPHCGDVAIPLEDELRFVALRFGHRWARWVLARSKISRTVRVSEALAAVRRIGKLQMAPSLLAYRRPLFEGVGAPLRGRVTVLIPTVDSYPYLLKLLEQLRGQSVPPHEVVVVDQTPTDRRVMDLESRFPDLPLRAIGLDCVGQCSSRNAGLEAATGDHIRFLDDYEEVPKDLIERQLQNAARYESGVSSGVAVEVGAGPLP